MESVFVIGLGCVGWTAFEVFRLASTSVTIAVPAGARAMRPLNPCEASRTGQASSPAEHSGRVPRFAAWDDRGRPVTVEDLGRA